MIEPEKSIKKYLFWRWEYLRRNKQYIYDYSELLNSSNGNIDMSPLFSATPGNNDTSCNKIYEEKLLNFTKTYYIYPCNPTVKISSFDMLQRFVNDSLYDNSAPLIICGLPPEMKCKNNQLEKIGYKLIGDTYDSITIEFNVNTDLNILIQGLTAHYEKHKASICSTEYLIKCCQKDAKDMTYEEYRFMTDCFKVLRQEYTDICDNIFFNNMIEADEEYYNKTVKAYIVNNAYTIPRDDMSRLVGLWLWENMNQNGGKHNSIINAIEEFESLTICDSLNLGRDPSYYLWLDKTQSCIDAGEVLSITKRHSSAQRHRSGFGTQKRKVVPGTKSTK